MPTSRQAPLLNSVRALPRVALQPARILVRARAEARLDASSVLPEVENAHAFFRALLRHEPFIEFIGNRGARGVLVARLDAMRDAPKNLTQHLLAVPVATAAPSGVAAPINWDRKIRPRSDADTESVRSRSNDATDHQIATERIAARAARREDRNITLAAAGLGADTWGVSAKWVALRDIGDGG